MDKEIEKEIKQQGHLLGVKLYNEGYKEGIEANKEEYDKKLQELRFGMLMAFDVLYEQGLIDAWNCVKKIVNLEWAEQRKLFEVCNCYPSKQILDVLNKYTASEAIKIIKEYEEGGKEND